MTIVRAAAACWLVLMLMCGSAGAVPDTPHLADLHRYVWTSKDGAPTDIFSMAQTRDGWLWLSTNNGLYRFDGVRFERFVPRHGEALLEARITNLYAAPDGDLWFGYSGGNGMTRLRQGHLTHHRPSQPVIGSMYGGWQDPDGSLWLGSSTGLLHHVNASWRKIGTADGARDGVASNILVDQDGRVWVTISARLFVRDRPGAQFRPVQPDHVSGGFATTPDGRLWIETPGKMTVLDRPLNSGALPSRPTDGTANSGQFLFDRAGNFWTRNGGNTVSFIPANALVGKTTFDVDAMPVETVNLGQARRARAQAFLEDREGNVWVATSAGLERYRSQRISTLPVDEKYRTYTLANDGPAALWIVARPMGDLWRLTDDAFVQIPGQFDYFDVRGVRGGANVFAGKRGIERRAPGTVAVTAIKDGNGQIAPAINARYGDFDGTDYWAFDFERGTVKLTPEGWRTVEELGFQGGRGRVRADRAGHLWMLYDDKIIDTHPTPPRVYRQADGLDIGRLNAIEVQHEVVVLADSGVAVKVGASFHRLRVDRPELLANARAMTVSANGDRWINANSGLVRIRAADWLAWLAQPKRVLDTTLFDTSDGYPGAQGSQTSSMATTDNGKRVWFVGKDGPASIDSTAITINPVPATVEVVRLTASARAYFGDDTPALAAGTRNIGIDYAALSYAMPERIRFRYRLIGLDEQWRDAGTRRTVDYTNLGPGDYRFQVIAANEDGVWGTRPATMAFSIAPLFTQTWWFYSLCAVAALGVLSVLYHARVRSVRKHAAARMHERLYERERIARTLHDTYLQSVQGLIYVFEGLAQRQPRDALRPGLARALEMADDVLTQGRAQVLGLRMSAGANATLEQLLAESGEALADKHPMTCTIRSNGAVRTLRGHVLEELFCIGREALVNAFRHSQGSEVDVELGYEAHKFTLCIQDDGIGLSEPMLVQGNRAGHWGLPGMRERADTIHAALAIFNRPGGGLRIVLTLPARTAYARQAHRWHTLTRWWPRR